MKSSNCMDSCPAQGMSLFRKGFILFIFILGYFQSHSQDLKPIAQKINNLKQVGTVPAVVNLLETSSLSGDRILQLQSVVKQATILDIKKTDILQVLSDQPENIEFIIPGQNGVYYKLELFRASIFSPDFSVETATGNDVVKNYSEGLHYWGIINGDNHSLAAISIFQDEIMGLISSDNGNFILGKLKGDPDNHHIFYNDKDLNSIQTINCATVSDDVPYERNQLEFNSSKTLQSCIRLYWEVNYDIFLDKGSVSNTVNYVTGLFNESALLYANDNIPVTLSQVYVWNISSPYNGTSTSALLGQFQNYRNSFNGDLGHLLGYIGGGGIAAGFSGLCASNLDDSQCYSMIYSSFSSVPVYSWSVEVVTHEQGHLMGSRHTHACVWNGNGTAIDGCAPSVGYGYEGTCSGAPIPSNGGTIMSYCHLVTGVGINFSNGFGPQPAAVILNNFNSASCLTNCSGVGCFSPNNLVTSAITTSTATLTWDSVPGAIGYYVRYRISGILTWTLDSTVTNFYNAAGLAAGTTYEWEVQTKCSGGNSPFTSTATFITVPLSCNAPVGLTATAIGSSSAILNWTAVGGAVSYMIEYRETGAIPYLTGVSTVNSFSVVNLNPLTTYEWHVQSACSGGGISPASVDSFFTTLASPMPVACYPFSGNANDASGNNHHGTVYGPLLTTDRFGNPNSAYLFDGVDDYINVGNYSNIIPTGNNFSMSVWTQANFVKLQVIIMMEPDYFNDRLNATVYYNHNGVPSTFWDYGDCTNGGRSYNIGTTFSPAWEHYVFIVNSTQNYMEVYKNGILDVHVNHSSPLVNRSRDLHIGGAIANGNVPFYFSGKIDDMAIYDQVLSASEIQTLFSQQILCLNSVGMQEDLLHSGIQLWPNVSNNGSMQLILPENTGKLSYKVFNCLGQEIKSFIHSGNNGTIDLQFSDLSKGIYFLDVKTELTERKFKFIID